MIVDKGNYKLYKGDCLQVMDGLISLGVKVDMVLTDLPYSITKNDWDNIIDFNLMWDRINKIVKTNGAILLFADEPFTSRLILSNINNFRYRITWDKVTPTGFFNANKMPLKRTEDICVFYKKLPTYNPQMVDAEKITPKATAGYSAGDNYKSKTKTKSSENYDETKRFPTTLYSLSKLTGECANRKKVHPTQKPVMLLENWIKTYTNEGDLVLDFTQGSGSTGVACMNTNRRYIGIELDDKYFDISVERLEDAVGY